MITALCLAVVGSFLLGCEDKSDDIPTYSPGDDDLQAIWSLMDDGWDHYASGDFEDAQDCFRSANQRNANYLAAYNGLGWCAVRLNDFVDAEIQFSFITTLADPAEQSDLLLLADAYAGLCLSATIERLFMEIAGELDETAYDALSRESIDMAELVFALLGEDYAPADHDPGFGSQNLHLMSAQNYFYLQEFWNAESELTIVDAGFVDSLSTALGDTMLIVGEDTLSTINEIMELDELTMNIGGVDTTIWALTPAVAAVHHVTEITAPDTSWGFSHIVLFGEDVIWIKPSGGTVPVVGDQLTVSYVYIADLPKYLNELIARIQGLILL